MPALVCHEGNEAGPPEVTPRPMATRDAPGRAKGHARRDVALRSSLAGQPSADTTWSMHCVSFVTSSGSTAGNIATRTWLRPSLR